MGAPHTCPSVPIAGQPTSPTGNGDVGWVQAAEGNVQSTLTPLQPHPFRLTTRGQAPDSGLGGPSLQPVATLAIGNLTIATGCRVSASGRACKQGPIIIYR